MITLATLPQATAQQVFDQVAIHLLTQKMKARIYEEHNGYQCQYRTPDGRKCAAGCLISDEEFDTLIKEKYNNIPWPALERKEIVPFEHHELIRNLQRCHDHNSPDNWKLYLLDIAKAFNLSSRILEDFPDD